MHRLVLCDSETLRPGNCVRHLAGAEHSGKAKTEAVRDVIHAAGHDPPGGIETREAVRTRADAAALHSGTPAITAYLQRGGEVARVDRWPLADGEVRLEEVPPPPGPPDQPLREGGCGDPVSPAPPHAAVTARPQPPAPPVTS